MRQLALLIPVGLMVAGCTSAAPKQPATQLTTMTTVYQAQAASALAFDPPISRFAPPMDLSREGREPSAFAGFNEVEATFYRTQIDDRHTDDGTSRYERRAMSEKVGVNYR